ncbi:MAG: zinc ribbon domain-containing protein [Polyangiales bacterium]
MPTYNYRCAACNHEFERVQRITEDAIRTCPACNAEAASRLITSGNFILRGSGWYADAYSGGSNKGATKSTPTSSTTTTTSASSDSAAAPSAPSAPSTPSSSGGSST